MNVFKRSQLNKDKQGEEILFFIKDFPYLISSFLFLTWRLRSGRIFFQLNLVKKATLTDCVFSHNVMAAIFVSQNNEAAAMFVSQTSPVWVELFSYVNAFFCSNKFA